MKIRIKIDTPIAKNNSEGFEFELDLNNFIYQMFPPNIISYYNAINNAKGDSSKFIGGNIPDIPGVLPVTGHDIFNYVAKFGTANFQIQAVMKFNGQLNPYTLLKAVRLSIEAEPVLGSRIIENNPPYWKLRDLDKTKFCSFEKTTDSEQAVQYFLQQKLDMDDDPMLQLKLISDGFNDTLCIKINHSCCDGTGTKEYLNLLSEIYSTLEHGENYMPKPKNRSRIDQDRLFSFLGINNPESVWNGQLDLPKNMWPFPWLQGKPVTYRVSVCKLSKEYFSVISKYAKARGATINDMILTAVYRAMFGITGIQPNIPMDISITADLRRYLADQKTEGIRNFSGGVDTKLESLGNEPFEGTLLRVASMMNEIKKNLPGLQSAVGLERVEKAIFSETLSYYLSAAQNTTFTEKCSPVVSNLGFINKSLLKFGDTYVTDAYIVPPAVSAPGILLCIGTYNNEMTMAMSHYEEQVYSEDIKRLLYTVRKELIEGCLS